MMARVNLWACGILVVTALFMHAASAQAASERVDAATLKSARPIPVAPLPPAELAARYGTTLDETLKKMPGLKPAITALAPPFFVTRGTSDPNKAFRMAGGKEFLVLTGCTNAYQCDLTRYCMLVGVTDHTVGFVEQAEVPHFYWAFGAAEPTLRNLLFGLSAVVLEPRAAAQAKALAYAAQFQGMTLLPQSDIDHTYGDLSNGLETHPDVQAAVQRVYKTFMLPSEECGLRLRDGRELLLLTASSSNADGSVAHGVAYDLHHKQAFVHRDDGQLGGEAWFGNPSADLKTVLSSVSEGCSKLRADMGLDPNDTTTTGPSPTHASSAAPPAASCATVAATDPHPGSYALKKGAHLTVANDCATITVTDPHGEAVIQGTTHPDPKGAAVSFPDTVPSGCWAYRFRRKPNGSIQVSWAQDLIPSGKGIAPDCETISGEYTPLAH